MQIALLLLAFALGLLNGYFMDTLPMSLLAATTCLALMSITVALLGWLCPEDATTNGKKKHRPYVLSESGRQTIDRMNDLLSRTPPDQGEL